MFSTPGFYVAIMETTAALKTEFIFASSLWNPGRYETSLISSRLLRNGSEVWLDILSMCVGN